jgi:hypothetical protein
VARIEAIQQELETLKRTFIANPANARRKTELKGLWRGVEISEEDIAEAKQAVFKAAYQFESQ